MSKFLIPVGAEISLAGEVYKADERGVVEVPFELEETLVNQHGLTLFVDAEPVKAPAKAGKGKDAPATEAPAE